jgi:parvulin-like peptidyl-prolyl isomerase
MRYLLTLSIFVTSVACGQLVEKTRSLLTTIQTVEQANAYLSKADAPTGQVFTMSSTTDTTANDRELIALKPGASIEFESEDQKTHYFYKSLAVVPLTAFRVQYIYLDQSKLSVRQIDSLRTIILNRLKIGDPFELLAQTYSMDGNAKKGGDLGWFPEGMMERSFETQIKKHKLGEVFTVDIPAQQWYYIVKNTHAPRTDQQTTLLFIEVKH